MKGVPVPYDAGTDRASDADLYQLQALILVGHPASCVYRTRTHARLLTPRAARPRGALLNARQVLYVLRERYMYSGNVLPHNKKVKTR